MSGVNRLRSGCNHYGSGGGAACHYTPRIPKGNRQRLHLRGQKGGAP